MNLFLNIDVDECATNMDNCHSNAVCTNSIGSFSCVCVSGYSGNGVDCFSMFKSRIVSVDTIIVFYNPIM